MTKYTKFEAIFRNETLVFTDRDPKFRNRLEELYEPLGGVVGMSIVVVKEEP